MSSSGVLANCNNCQISNVAANANGTATGYGIDAGCAVGAHIHSGSLANNVIGINIGCSTGSEVRGVEIISSKTAGITGYSTEASGDGFGITGFTSDLSITGNRIVCPASGSPHGILTTQGAVNLEIVGNQISGCTPGNSIVSDLYSGRIGDNLIEVPDIAAANYSVNGARDPLLIPDGVSDTVLLSGINIFSNMFRFSQYSVGTGIGGIHVDVAGSGFINNEPATISGCVTNPTKVTVAADRAGRLTGLRLGTRGSGCTSPKLSFAHGTGQSATIMIGAWRHTSNEVSLLVQPGGSLTILTGGNVVLNKAVSGAGANSLLRLKLIRGQFIEESRNF